MLDGRIYLRVCMVLALAGCGDDDTPVTPVDGGSDAFVEPDSMTGGDADARGDARSPSTLYVDDLDDGEIGSGTEADPFRNLQDAIDAATDGDTIRVLEGHHLSRPESFVDPTCGNCFDADFRSRGPIDATSGFRIEDKSITIEGASRDGTVLETGAGYGVLFERAGSSTLRSLSITGGVRDANGLATNGAVVARQTALLVEDVHAVNNDNLYTGPEPDPIVGIAGIVGREGSDLTIARCDIENSSWDGITLYKGDPMVDGDSPHALVVDTIVHCTSMCGNPRGRGVGIGITWDATAEVVNNRISRYWKGIGAFGQSRVIATNNVVVSQLGWGVAASEDAHMEVINNVITSNGTTGFAALGGGVTGRLANNVITSNGWDVSEWVLKRTGVWLYAAPSYQVAYNDVWSNQLSDACTGDPCMAITLDGMNGNVSIDPMFADTTEYTLAPGSPLIDAGDPAILDPDGSRSDMGAHGGPDADRTEP